MTNNYGLGDLRQRSLALKTNASPGNATILASAILRR
jgi:hypothetical protein